MVASSGPVVGSSVAPWWLNLVALWLALGGSPFGGSIWWLLGSHAWLARSTVQPGGLVARLFRVFGGLSNFSSTSRKDVPVVASRGCYATDQMPDTRHSRALAKKTTAFSLCAVKIPDKQRGSYILVFQSGSMLAETAGGQPGERGRIDIAGAAVVAWSGFSS